MIIIISAFLALVLVLSLLREFPKVSTVLDQAPIFMSFIPSWNFFAPTPGMHDYHLMYRGISKKGEVQDWQEVYPMREKRGFFCFLWNPHKKLNKAVIDLTQELLRFCSLVGDEKQICMSVSYLHFLNYVSSLVRDDSLEKVQFSIMSSSKLFDYKVEFQSNMHPIRRG